MVWPTDSNFQRGRPLDAVWFVAQSNSATGPIQVCATQGRSFIKRLQRRLNGFNTGIELSRPALAIDGGWGTATNDALVHVAHQLTLRATRSDDVAVFRQVENELLVGARQRNISRVMLRFAIFVTYYLGDNWSWTTPYDRITTPLDVTPPRFGTTPDDDRGVGDGTPTCWDRDRDTAPVPATREQVDQAQRVGTTGVQQAPGRGTGATDPAAVASGQQPTGRGGRGGVVLLVLLGLAAAAGGKGGRRRRR